VVPDVPLELPSTLLLRRPDIAAAERRAAQANEQIGIAQSAYYPSLRLNGSAGLGAASIGDLFSASALVWSLGAALAQSLSGQSRGLGVKLLVEVLYGGFEKKLAELLGKCAQGGGADAVGPSLSTEDLLVEWEHIDAGYRERLRAAANPD
jgi:hypothetical protein